MDLATFRIKASLWFLLQEKVRLKTEKDAAEAKFKFAMVDGRKEQVGHACTPPFTGHYSSWCILGPEKLLDAGVYSVDSLCHGSCHMQ